MSKMKRVLIVAVVLVLVSGGTAAWWVGHHREGNGAQLTLYGNVDLRQVQLAFDASGRIESMPVQEGQRVKKGELLARLDTRRLQENLKQAQAQVQAQQEVVNRLEAGTRPEDIRKARADLDLAKAQRINARLSFNRISDLAKREMASRQQRDDAEAALNVANAKVKAAKAALELALAGPRKEDIAAAKASLQADQAKLGLAKTNLQDSDLYAPASGIIQNRLLEPGDMASAQNPVYTLALTQPLWVRAYVDEPDLGKLTEGMPVTVSTDSFPDKRYAGWVGYISPTAQFTPKTVESPGIRTDLVYEIRVYVCDDGGELRLGMPATVHVDLSQKGKNGVQDCGRS
ncbi:MAG: efflux RND transporter periplasmic adaptor subunit [Gammaproteobacteria bacterium]